MRQFVIGFLKHIPQPWLNRFLLAWPSIYRTRFVAYESHLSDASGRLTEIVLRETREVPGDIIECGAARCGTSCFVGTQLKENNINKKVYALDSFQGFDKNELHIERAAGLTNAGDDSFTYTSPEYVERKIRGLGLESYVVPIGGWFKETLPTLCGPFSFAIIDCDLERSIEDCLEYVWPRLSIGGLIMIDDYGDKGYLGSQRAVDRFVRTRGSEIASIRTFKRFEISK